MKPADQAHVSAVTDDVPQPARTLERAARAARPRADRKFSATRQCGSKGSEETITSGNFVGRPAGAKPARPRVSPPEPVASLATIPEMGSAMRRHANVWAMGHAAPKPLTFPDAQGAELPEGSNGLSVRWARSGPYPAGCSTMARTKRTAQAPGRPSPLLDPFRPRGEPVIVSDARRVGRGTCRRPPGIEQAPASR